LRILRACSPLLPARANLILLEIRIADLDRTVFDSGLKLVSI